MQATATLVITGLSASRTVEEFSREVGWVSTFAIAVDLATDTLNTAGLWYYLHAQKSAVFTCVNPTSMIETGIDWCYTAHRR